MNTHKGLWWASQPKEYPMSIRNETAEREQDPTLTGLKRVVAASMAASVVALIAVYFTRETKGIDLESIDQADRDDLAKAGVA
jgi:hypothetical protein